jgi:anti-sigma factor RsiW
MKNAHADIQALLGAFALDAVEPDEARIIEAHLTECPRCRAEVVEHRDAASLLSFSGAAAPEGVWPRIAADLDETPAPLQLPRRTAAERPLAFRLMAVAAAVVALLAIQVVRDNQRIDRLSSIASQHGLAQAAAAAAVAPDARKVRLSSNDGAHVVDAVVLSDGRGYLVRSRLAALGRDETYQLWGVIGAQSISLGVIGDDPTITPFKAVGPLKALAITVEHTGGAVAPTTSPVVQGFVST